MDRSIDKLIPISAAATHLGVTITTLRRWHNEGSFKATFVSPGGHRYYSIADLDKKTKGIFRLAQEWASAEVSYIPEHDFYCSTIDRFKARQESMAHIFDRHPPLRETASLLSSAAGEIGNNSFEHNLGNWPDVAGAFFAYDLAKGNIVLADRGVGVLSTLRKARSSLATDAEALNVAFTEYLTGRAPEHRGNGLKYVKAAIQKAGANLSFQSGDSVLEIKKGSPTFKIKKAVTPIRGCLVYINF